VHHLTIGDRVRVARASVGSAFDVVAPPLVRRLSPALGRRAVVGWVAVSGALLLLFVLVHGSSAVARRGWPVQSVHGTAVRVAPGFGPAVVGLVRPEIVVPRWLLDRPDDEQRLILAHEREHLRARDHLLLSAAWLCAIVFPWHPAVWYLVNRVRLAIELDCDARVLRSGVSRRTYGALLIDMAAQGRGARLGVLALADGASHLERRIRAMQVEKGRHGMTRGLALGALGALMVLVACEAKVPTAAELTAMDVASAEQGVARVQPFATPYTIAADYFIDGKPASAAAARALSPQEVASLEVVKRQSAQGRDTIFVTTTWAALEIKMRDVEPRRGQEEELTPLPAIREAVGNQAVLMIDGVVQQPGVRSAIDAKPIASVSILKPGKLAAYPNGLIAIETKPRDRTHTTGSGPMHIMWRTDSVIVSSKAGLVAASRLWTGGASDGPQRVVLMPRADSGGSYRFGVRDVERAADDSALAPPSAAGPKFDPTKPFAIEIDGVRATRAELEALRATGAKLSYTMYPRDARELSSDPAAANGLMQVRTTRALKP
jgi:hypothetical protein